MEFPKRVVDGVQRQCTECLELISAGGVETAPDADIKDLLDLIKYAEYANAKLQELENQCSALMFKLRCVAQALK